MDRVLRLEPPSATAIPTPPALIDEVQAEYVVRYGGRDESPVDPLMFDPPHGTFLVGYLDAVPVGHRRLAAPYRLEALGTSRDRRDQADVRRPGGPRRAATPARPGRARAAPRGGRHRGDRPRDRPAASRRRSRSTSRPATPRSRRSATTASRRSTAASRGGSSGRRRDARTSTRASSGSSTTYASTVTVGLAAGEHVEHSGGAVRVAVALRSGNRPATRRRCRAAPS